MSGKVVAASPTTDEDEKDTFSIDACAVRPVQGMEKQGTGNPTLPRDFPIETMFFSKRFLSPNAVDFPVSYKGNVREEGEWVVGQFFIGF